MSSRFLKYVSDNFRTTYLLFYPEQIFFDIFLVGLYRKFDFGPLSQNLTHLRLVFSSFSHSTHSTFSLRPSFLRYSRFSLFQVIEWEKWRGRRRSSRFEEAARTSSTITQGSRRGEKNAGTTRGLFVLFLFSSIFRIWQILVRVPLLIFVSYIFFTESRRRSPASEPRIPRCDSIPLTIRRTLASSNFPSRSKETWRRRQYEYGR